MNKHKYIRRQVKIGFYIDRLYRLKERTAERKRKDRNILKTILLYEDTYEYKETYYRQLILLGRILSRRTTTTPDIATYQEGFKYPYQIADSVRVRKD